jgi:hypothetical protein
MSCNSTDAAIYLASQQCKKLMKIPRCKIHMVCQHQDVKFHCVFKSHALLVKKLRISFNISEISLRPRQPHLHGGRRRLMRLLRREQALTRFVSLQLDGCQTE